MKRLIDNLPKEVPLHMIPHQRNRKLILERSDVILIGSAVTSKLLPDPVQLRRHMCSECECEESATWNDSTEKL